MSCRRRLRCGSDCGVSWLAIAPNGRLNRAVEIFVSIFENHAEEGTAVGVPLQVGPIRRPHHAMPEPVCGSLELHGHEALPHARLVETTTVLQDVVHHRLADEQRQELLQQHPVVVPGRQLPRLLERCGPCVTVVAGPVDRLVVEEHEGTVQTRDHHVLVVARIGDDRRVRPLRPLMVLEQAAEPDRQLVVVGGVVQLRARHRTGAVHRVEIEGRRARVGGRARIRRHP